MKISRNLAAHCFSGAGTVARGIHLVFGGADSALPAMTSDRVVGA
jgi:hypothetical protein